MTARLPRVVAAVCWAHIHCRSNRRCCPRPGEGIGGPRDLEFEPMIEARFAAIKQGFDHIRERNPKR
jgi:hypothetical protein